jgi:hypothetical protein
MTSSVLAFLATRFATHPENLATEALNFILANSSNARHALLDICQRLGHVEKGDLVFTAQVTNGNGSRPDLVGRAIDGSSPIVIEAKFWAGLTDNQPKAYLDVLPENGLLLFVAPAARADTLWPELLRRARDGGPLVPVPQQQDTCAERIGTHTLALISWRALLGHLHNACALANEPITADIRQLQALCEKMDTQAFLPLRPEDLTANTGRRVMEFCDLADRVTDSLVALGRVSVKGLRATGGKGWYGRYMRFRGHGALLHFDARTWNKRGQSPLWLALYGRGFKPCIVEPNTLREHHIPYHMSSGHCMIPIMLLEGAEHEEVIKHAQQQIINIIASAVDLGALSDAQPPEMDDPEAVSV